MENKVCHTYRVIWCNWWVHPGDAKFYMKVELLNEGIPKKYQIKEFDLEWPQCRKVGFGSTLIFSYADVLGNTISHLIRHTPSDFYQDPLHCNICNSEPAFYDDEICCPRCRLALIEASCPEDPSKIVKIRS